MREGPWVAWNPPQPFASPDDPLPKSYEGSYLHGDPHGPWTLWRSNGRKLSERVYDRGKVVSGTTWDEDGNVFHHIEPEDAEAPGEEEAAERRDP